MRFNEFKQNNNAYMTFTMAERRAKKEEKKVIENENGLYEVVDMSDPRPATIRNPKRLDLEPILKREYERLRNEKTRFLNLKRRIDIGFVRKQDYPEINDEKYKELSQDISAIRRQLDSLPNPLTIKK